MKFSKSTCFIIFLIFPFFYGISFAQSKSILSDLVNDEFKKYGNDSEVVSNLLKNDREFKNLSLPVNLSSYISHYNKERAAEIIRNNAPLISIELKNIYGQNQVLDLINSSETFNNLKISTALGEKFLLRDLKIIHYRGIIRGIENSFVALTLTENEMSGVISTNDGNFVLGKLENSEQHIYYNDESIGQQLYWSCNAEENDKSIKSNFTYFPNMGNDSKNVIQKCVKIYYETDYEIFQNKGSVANVVAYVTGLHNQVSTLYINEGINMPLSEIMVWDTDTPYYGNYAGIRSDFSLYLPSLNDADLGHFLMFTTPSSESYPGGYSTTGGVCGLSEIQKLSVSTINNFYYTVPTYSHSAYAITHQFGHSLGSQDTHFCVWNGNNTSIDGCGFQTNGNGCPGPIPSLGGTIMSFCDRIPGVGINFSNGFGPQPGDKIRVTVANAPCLDECFYCEENLIITEPITVNTTHQVSNKIEAYSEISPNKNVYFKGNQIILGEGFSVTGHRTGDFRAIVDPCSSGGGKEKENRSQDEFRIQENKIQPVLSPNPTSSFLNVTNIEDMYEWKLIDINGKIVDSGRVNNSVQNKITINTSKLIPGIYYFNAAMKNGELFQKTVMKK